jgi:predicted nucleic acid-binding protein
LFDELAAQRIGRALRWSASHRQRPYWTTVVSVGELAASMESMAEARAFIGALRVASLSLEVSYEAAAIDRELMRAGQRMGENDNWIAGFARYYGEPIGSNDEGFDRVPGIRRIGY